MVNLCVIPRRLEQHLRTKYIVQLGFFGSKFVGTKYFSGPDIKFKTLRENFSVLSLLLFSHFPLQKGHGLDWTAPPYLKQPFSAK